jgi:hypothetical protein
MYHTKTILVCQQKYIIKSHIKIINMGISRCRISEYGFKLELYKKTDDIY